MRIHVNWLKLFSTLVSNDVTWFKRFGNSFNNYLTGNISATMSFLSRVTEQTSPTIAKNGRQWVFSIPHWKFFRTSILQGNYEHLWWVLLWFEAAVPRWSSKQLFLRIWQISQENTCVGVSFCLWSLCVGGLRPATLLKRGLQHRCFFVKFAKFLRTLFLQNTSGGCFCMVSLFLAY